MAAEAAGKLHTGRSRNDQVLTDLHLYIRHQSYLLAQDLNGNSTRGDVILENSRGSLVLGGTRLVAGIGLDDLIVVDTPDALLICRKNQVGEVRKLVARLKEEGRADLV